MKTFKYMEKGMHCWNKNWNGGGRAKSTINKWYVFYENKINF